jgi:hypothetical protein
MKPDGMTRPVSNVTEALARNYSAVVGNKSVENLAEREGFEPSVHVLARTTV